MQMIHAGSTTVCILALLVAVALAVDITAEPAPNLQALFDFKQGYGWMGGDSDTTLNLPDGRVLWLFAGACERACVGAAFTLNIGGGIDVDTFIGDYDAGKHQRVGANVSMPHDSAGRPATYARTNTRAHVHTHARMLRTHTRTNAFKRTRAFFCGHGAACISRVFAPARDHVLRCERPLHRLVSLGV